jgi:hypothetical protein
MVHGNASAFLASAKDAQGGEASVGDGAPRPGGDRNADAVDAEKQERSREQRP